MATRLTFKPVTKSSWPDFETLFQSPGAPKYCWCMAFRSTPEEVPTPGPKRKPFIKKRVDAGTPIGLVGYLEGEPVAWVSIAPRDTYRRLGGPKAGDDEVIWSLACMYVARNHRKEGLSAELIEAASAYARKRGATAIEAYPVSPDSPSYRFMGFVPAFKRLGFEEVARAGKRRHILRLPLRG